MGAKFLALQEEFEELEEQHQEAMVNFRAIRDEAIRLLKRKERPIKKSPLQTSTSPKNISSQPRRQNSPGILTKRLNQKQSKIRNIPQQQLEGEQKGSRSGSPIHKKSKNCPIKGTSRRGIILAESNRILNRSIQGSSSSLANRNDRFKKTLLNDNNSKQKQRDLQNVRKAQVKKSRSHVLSIYHSMKPSQTQELGKIKNLAISVQNVNSNEEKSQLKRQQRSLNRDRLNEQGDNDVILQTNDNINNRSIENNAKSNPNIPVYFELQKKLPRIYAQKQLIKFNSKRSKNSVSPLRGVDSLNKNSNLANQDRNSMSFSRISRIQLGGGYNAKSKRKLDKSGFVKSSTEQGEESYKNEQEEKKNLELSVNSIMKLSNNALQKVSRKGIITQDNRKTITIPANIRQKKLIFQKSKRAQFNRQTEKHVSFWLNRREGFSERRNGRNDELRLNLSMFSFKYKEGGDLSGSKTMNASMANFFKGRVDQSPKTRKDRNKKSFTTLGNSHTTITLQTQRS